MVVVLVVVVVVVVVVEVVVSHLGDDAHDRKHGHAPVLELRLAQELNVKELGQAKRVETNVTDHARSVLVLHILRHEHERNRRRHLRHHGGGARRHPAVDGGRGCEEGEGGGCARVGLEVAVVVVEVEVEVEVEVGGH